MDQSHELYSENNKKLSRKMKLESSPAIEIVEAFFRGRFQQC